MTEDNDQIGSGQQVLLQVIEPEPQAEDRRWIVKAFIADLAILLVAAFVISVQQRWPHSLPVTDRIVIGLALMLVAVVTFFGFYLASPGTASSRDPWMRNSITAAFVVLYLVLVALMLVAPGFGETVTDPAFGEQVFSGLTGFLAIVLAFYFSATAVERVTDKIQTAQTIRTAIEQQPENARELVAVQQRTYR